jgi:NAD(P)H dehydrogenase (quinone)
VQLLAAGPDFHDWDALEAADVIIFGALTYTGGPSAQFKSFMNSISKAVRSAGSRWKDKTAAGAPASNLSSRVPPRPVPQVGSGEVGA